MMLIDTSNPGLLRLVFPTIGLIIAVTVLRFFYRLYQVRTLVRNVSKKHGIVS